jgi:hypothetical protein
MYRVDMSGISHFWSRSRRKKKFWSRSRREKVLGLGPGPFRNKFWCRSQSKIFWWRSRSKKNILVPVLFRKNFGADPSEKKFGPGNTSPISSTETEPLGLALSRSRSVSISVSSGYRSCLSLDQSLSRSCLGSQRDWLCVCLVFALHPMNTFVDFSAHLTKKVRFHW